MQYKLKQYKELSLDELYEILRLRQEVFIVEQNCPYLDTDGKDQIAHHLMGYNESQQLVTYTRLLPINTSYKNYISIGRVITAMPVRGMGMGKELMEQSIHHIVNLYPDLPIKISAQLHLSDFYQSVGFYPVGESYLEDDIPHIAMVLPIAPTSYIS